MMLQVGDQVRWRHAFRESTAKNALGTITAVIPNETGVDDFTLYDIQFEFGTFTLYAAQIEQEPEQTPTDGVRRSERSGALSAANTYTFDLLIDPTSRASL